MAASACNTFFRLPELIAHLAPLLSKRDLSNLSRSNRALNSICTPLFWRHLNLLSGSQRFINSPEAHEGCNANIDSIRTVLWKVDGSWYYINALWKYLHSTTAFEAHKAIPTDALIHPSWGQLSTTSIDDTFIQPLYPLLRLTHYTTYSSDTYYVSTDRMEPAYVSGDREPHQHQLLWLLRLNQSTLTQLELIDAPLLSPNLIRDLCRTISQLETLKTLHLQDPQPGKNFSFQVLKQLFFSCPPSLVELSVRSLLDMSTKNVDLDPQEYDWDLDQGPLLVRKEPLWHLESLHLRLIDTHAAYSAPLLSSILKHCPTLRTTTLPPLRHSEVVQAVSNIIGDSCLSITSLTFPYLSGGNDEAFMIIMDRMHEQRLEKIQVESLTDKSSSLLSFSAFLRHSTTLHQVEFDNCRQLTSATLRAILTSCHVLETLKVVKESGLGLSDKVALSLEDAVETAWVCTRIRYLTILVKITPDGRDPKYLAEPTMLTWTEQDHHHWEMLDKFYTQIGLLRELEILSLKAVGTVGSDRSTDVPFRKACLPGLLALEDSTKTTGQIGFLSRWAGLDKLQELTGSFSVTTQEVCCRMGKREVEWFVEHLPALRTATLVATTVDKSYTFWIPKIVQYLQELRPEVSFVEFLK